MAPFYIHQMNRVNSRNIPPTPQISSFPFSLCHCLVTHLSASDSFTIMALYKFTYLLTYLQWLCHDDSTINVVLELLSRRSRLRDRLSASMLSICSLLVCLSVVKMQKKTRFSQKLSNLELWCLLTTYRKSYMGFKKTLLDP